MAIMRWDPFTALARLDSDFDELVRRAWGPTMGNTRTVTGFVPAVDVVRDGADVLVTVELPGVDLENDVEVEVSAGRLVISGERNERTEQTSEEGRVLVRELRSGSFRREFALPEHVTSDDVEATYDKGLLTVRVRNVTKPESLPKKIQVRKAELPAVEES